MQYKRYLFFTVLFLLAVGKWMKEQQDQRVAVSDTKVVTKKPLLKNNSLLTAQVNKEIKINCPNMALITEKDIAAKEQLAHNLHYKKNGEVYRIRVFLEDGDNGSFRKLVHYKEDLDGFPQIEPLPPGKEREPSEQYLKSFYKDSEIIYDEKDYRLELKNGREIRISEIDGKLVKLNSQQDDCFIEKE